MDKDLQIELLLKELKEKDKEIEKLKQSNNEVQSLRRELNHIKIHGLKPLSSYDNTVGRNPGGASYDTPYLAEARRRGFATAL